MPRRIFDQEGKVTKQLLLYTEAIKAVAKEKRAALMGLRTASGVPVEKFSVHSSVQTGGACICERVRA